MKILFRILVTLVSGVATLYLEFLVFSIGGATLVPFKGPLGLLPFWLLRWTRPLVAIAVVAMVCRYVWTRTAALQAGLISSMVLGALVTGGVGFTAGFFGPIIFTPGANQGPLLGILITGPLGFVAGALGGVAYWVGWGRRRSSTSQRSAAD